MPPPYSPASYVIPSAPAVPAPPSLPPLSPATGPAQLTSSTTRTQTPSPLVLLPSTHHHRYSLGLPPPVMESSKPITGIISFLYLRRSAVVAYRLLHPPPVGARKDRPMRCSAAHRWSLRVFYFFLSFLC